MELNNREIATLVWMAVGVIAIVAYRPTRKALAAVLRSLFQRVFALVFGSAAVYVLTCVVLLAALQVWTWDNLKTTIVWTIGFAFVSMFSLNRIDEDRTYFRRTIRESFSLTGALIFVAQFYAFGLAVELILLPIVTLVAMMNAVAELKVEHAPARGFLTGLLSIIGLSYFAYSAYQTVSLWSEFATVHTAREFVLPILLTLLFLPYLYAMSVYFVYDRVFSVLRFGIKNDGLRRFAKRGAIRNFRLDIDLLKRWRRMVMLERPDTREDITRSLHEVKILHAREKNPPTIDPVEGWSPYVAKEFLAEQGIVSEDYHRVFEEWQAGSKMLRIGAGGFGNALMYFVSGTERAATQLSLELTVNKIETRDEADEAFAAMARTLLSKALGDEATALLPASLDDFEAAFDGARVRLKTETWTINKLHSYERELTIEHAAHRPAPLPDFTD